MARLRAARITDLVTEDGELLRVVKQREPRCTYGMGAWMIVWTGGMKDRAKQIKHGVTWRVLTWLGDELNFTDFRRVRTVEIAADLGSGSGSISRAMQELETLGILEREGKGAQSAWRFSSDFGWQGNADQFHAFRSGRLKGKKPPAVPQAKTESCILHTAASGAAVPSDPEQTKTDKSKSKADVKQSTLRLLSKIEGSAAP